MGTRAHAHFEATRECLAISLQKRFAVRSPTVRRLESAEGCRLAPGWKVA